MAEERRDDRIERHKDDPRATDQPAAAALSTNGSPAGNGAAVAPDNDTPASWPDGIRKLAFNELSALGIDVNQRLYWHGKPIALGQMLVLTSSQKVWGVILATGALLAFLATIAQGWVAGMTWMCQVGWIHTWCPAA